MTTSKPPTMTTAKFTADDANPSWYPRVLRTLARDYPEINDEVWSRAIGENAAEQCERHQKEGQS